MRLRFSIFLVGLAVVWAGVAIVVPAQTPSAGSSSPNRTAQPGPFVLDGLDLHDYEIREIDLDGLKKLLLRDPKDTRPLLVNFWATWCDGCREEFPDLVKIDNDYRAKGLNFLSVTLDEVSDKTKAVDFLKEMKATMPVVLLNVNDPEPAIHAVDEKWDGAMPATFLYDREGKLVFKYFGKIKPAELRAAIDKAVGSKQ
jgi:thiol-disulfide isomerase/thioredoxin